MNHPMEALRAIREFAGSRQTVGIDDAALVSFLEKDETLAEALLEACRSHQSLQSQFPELLAGDEREASEALQADFVNFYPANTVNPNIALTARGPWIVTSHGAVLHDSGGYGMLGLGHSPRAIMEAMVGPT